MDELITINKVASRMGISSRTLRYWESAGLFKSTRDIRSGWRMYDDYALQCIRITDLLRRLDFSISEIKEIIEGRSIDSLCYVLKNQLSKLIKTQSELHARKEAISELIVILESESSFTLSSLENILLPLALKRKKHVISKLQGGFSMENIKSKFEDVQFVKMPPARTAAYSCVGTEPEDEAYGVVRDWINKNSLESTMRIFGFNTEPWPSSDNPAYGFGYCATIPEGIEIPKPLYEMRLPGGIYAVIPDSAYKGDPSYGWKKVHELCNDSEWEWKYDNDRNPGLEEHIDRAEGGVYIPILFPVKKKA